MSEYIVEQPDKPAKVVRDGWNVRIEWDFKQREEIVRCRDCVHCYDDDSVWMCAKLGFGIDYITSDEKPDGFCAWGERDSWITCKCGEEIELGNREFAICPSCGRLVRDDS